MKRIASNSADIQYYDYPLKTFISTSTHNTNTLSKNRYAMFSVDGKNNENTNNRR